jgi:hypothetical protein
MGSRGGVDHVGLITNVWYKPTQRYLIVHNIGGGADGRRFLSGRSPGTIDTSKGC